MLGSSGPSERKGDHSQLTDGRALAEEPTGGPPHSASPAQRFCALSFQP